MFFLNKYNEYKKQKEKQCCRKVTEQELDRLNHKIVSIYTLILLSALVTVNVINVRTMKKQQLNFDNDQSVFIFQSKKESKDQQSMQSSTTPDPGYQWESDNFTTVTNHHKREPRGQPFPSR